MEKDIQNLFINIKFYKKFLNYENIVLIAPSNTQPKTMKDKSILFIPEDSLIQKRKINEFLRKMKSITTIRDGWYEQQFLKMAYSRICKNEYYLLWDSDTIPIKNIQMFENARPFFDMKTEHHKPYFELINRLMEGLKFANRSYISEHMMIKAEFMKNLLSEIEMNSKLKGKSFWEKILFAINIQHINKSGFSEFETYGSYVDTRYPDFYVRRIWQSKRDAKAFYGSPINLNEIDINWLSQDYQALTFEKRHSFKKEIYIICKNSDLHKLFKPSIFFKKYKYIFKMYRKYKKRK